MPRNSLTVALTLFKRPNRKCMPQIVNSTAAKTRAAPQAR